MTDTWGHVHYRGPETVVIERKLTRSVNRRITNDWRREVPSLGVYRPRHLLRRVGPLLVGICLDRDSGGADYLPHFHVHCLAAIFPVVSLTLATSLRTERTDAADWVKVRWHDERYREAAARMVRQSLLPLEGDLRLAQVLDAYRRYMTTPLGRWQSALLYRDMVLLSTWVGDPAQARRLLDEALRVVTDEVCYRPLDGRAAFEQYCRERIARPELVHQTVESQIVALKVDRLPVSNLLR